jgi:hypothetical protein
VEHRLHIRQPQTQTVLPVPSQLRLPEILDETIATTVFATTMTWPRAVPRQQCDLQT